MRGYEQNASSWVYDELRQRIVNLIYKPGQEIGIQSLAEGFGVSRSPVRDALLRLGRDRLVDIFPQKGTRVAYLDRDIIMQERFLRAAVETRVLDAYMDRQCTVAQWDMSLSRLQADIVLQQTALSSGDVETFLQYDIDFHVIFYEDAGLERIGKVVQAHTGNEHRARLLNAKDTKENRDCIMAEHQAIMDAIRKKDKAEVKALLEVHLGRLTGQLDYLEKAYPDFFRK